MNQLLPHHSNMLEASGILPQQTEDTGYRSVTEKAELRGLGFPGYQQRVPGLLIPVLNAAGITVSYQYRPDSPRKSGGKSVKYETLLGSRMALHVPPCVRHALDDPRIPLVITEGIKKADSACSNGIWCLGLLGVWNWRGTNDKGGKLLLPDWDMIALNGRQVSIVFDSDITTKPHVLQAARRLVAVLCAKGAKARLLQIPASGDEKVGLDDYLAVGGRFEDLQPMPDSVESPARSESAAARAIALCEDTELFHTQDGEGYARIKVNGHYEVHRLRGQGFRTWLLGHFYRETGKPLSTANRDEAIESLCAKALYDSPERSVAMRIGHANRAIYIDLGDSEWSTVLINESGWTLTNDSPVLFHRTQDMLPLPLPQPGGSIDEFRKLLNPESDHDFVLLAAFLVGCYMNRDRGTFPLLVLTGEQGTAKTTVARMLSSIVDPRRTPVRMLGHADDVMLAASKSCVVAYDNVGKLTPGQSNLLCQIVTGSGVTRRQLYTDGEEFSISAKAPIILTGILDIVGAPDLAERSLFPRLARIDSASRKDEDTIWSEFEEVLPKILGWLFDTLSVAVRDLPNVRPDRSPRLADFYRFVLAAEPGFGRYAGAFEVAFGIDRARAREIAVEDSVLAYALIHWAEQELPIGQRTTTATELLGALKQYVPESEQKELPKSNTFVGELRKIAGILRDSGIEAVPLCREAGRRPIRIARTIVTSVTSVMPESGIGNRDDGAAYLADDSVTTPNRSNIASPARSDDRDDSDDSWEDLDECIKAS